VSKKDILQEMEALVALLNQLALDRKRCRDYDHLIRKVQPFECALKYLMNKIIEGDY
jgi:hypothetical protein